MFIKKYARFRSEMFSTKKFKMPRMYQLMNQKTAIHIETSSLKKVEVLN